nr:hypothetical protein [Tanacetum cinerariifolium]
MMKTRKVSGRGETSSSTTTTSHYAFGPQEDDIIIKHRLLTRTTTTRGEPPLKKLQKKFTSFALETEKPSDNYADCEKLAKAFLQEFKTFVVPLVKTKAEIAELEAENTASSRTLELRKKQFALLLHVEIAELEAENTASSRTLELRKKQFALLLHVVDELQNTIEEDQKSMIEEMRMAIYENKSIVEDAAGSSEAMAID